ncbi:MAG: hypothetical protein EB089_05440 [Acidimicrobiia bacterium]|nr:hypothetical protein [Acidimicrobiia bacterium]
MPPEIKAVKFDDLKTIRPKQFAISWVAAHDQRAERRQDETRPLVTGRVLPPVDARESQRQERDVSRRRHGRRIIRLRQTHQPDNEHWHLVLPLAKPVPGHMWSEVWVQLLERINVVGDPQTKDPARIFYRPQHRPGMTPGFKQQHGAFLDPGDLSQFRSMHAFRSPKTVTRQKTYESRRVAEILDERWWTDPQDLSRFNGMTQTEIAQSLLVEFRELRKTLNLH